MPPAVAVRLDDPIFTTTGAWPSIARLISVPWSAVDGSGDRLGLDCADVNRERTLLAAHSIPTDLASPSKSWGACIRTSR
jgi:hypothetical protein